MSQLRSVTAPNTHHPLLQNTEAKPLTTLKKAARNREELRHIEEVQKLGISFDSIEKFREFCLLQIPIGLVQSMTNSAYKDAPFTINQWAMVAATVGVLYISYQCFYRRAPKWSFSMEQVHHIKTIAFGCRAITHILQDTAATNKKYFTDWAEKLTKKHPKKDFLQLVLQAYLRYKPAQKDAILQNTGFTELNLKSPSSLKNKQLDEIDQKNTTNVNDVSVAQKLPPISQLQMISTIASAAAATDFNAYNQPNIKAAYVNSTKRLKNRIRVSAYYTIFMQMLLLSATSVMIPCSVQNVATGEQLPITAKILPGIVSSIIAAIFAIGMTYKPYMTKRTTIKNESDVLEIVDNLKYARFKLDYPLLAKTIVALQSELKKNLQQTTKKTATAK